MLGLSREVIQSTTYVLIKSNSLGQSHSKEFIAMESMVLRALLQAALG